MSLATFEHLDVERFTRLDRLLIAEQAAGNE